MTVVWEGKSIERMGENVNNTEKAAWAHRPDLESVSFQEHCEEIDAAHSKTIYRHNPHDQGCAEIRDDDGLGCARGCIIALLATALLSMLSFGAYLIYTAFQIQSITR
jgi:hypothetical protein